MAIPPKGDPRRPVALAVNAARTLGVLSLVLAALGLIGFVMTIGTADPRPLVAVFLGVGVMFVLPGILYLAFAGNLSRYQTWAAVVLLVMASLHTVVVCVSLAGTIVSALQSNRPVSDHASMVAFNAVFLAAGILLIVYLSQSFKVLRMYGRQPMSYGFQPVIPGRPVGAYPPPHQQQPAPPPPPPPSHRPPASDPPPGGER